MPSSKRLPSGTAWAALLVASATLLAFLPALGNGWVNWDDGVFLLDNPHFRGLTPSHLRWMFTACLSGIYQPLTWMTYAADYWLWGLAPAGYHFTSLLIHAANAVLFFLVARLIFSLCRTPAAPSQSFSLEAAAAAAALAFAVHPLRVESVAWATERRDVVCGAFFLGAVLSYLRAHSEGRRPVASLALFIGALLSKGLAVTLPLVLLILDAYPLRRLPCDPRRWLEPQARSVWLEKIPYFLLAAGIGLFTLTIVVQSRGLGNMVQYGLGNCLRKGAYGAIFYLSKTVLPIGLSPSYDSPADLGALGAIPWLAAGGIALITILAWRLRRDCPGLSASWLAYLAILAPVSGILGSGVVLVADRYSYLSCLSWALLAGACLRRGLESGLRRPAAATTAAVLLVLGGLSWRQTGVWKDSLTLWAHALKLDPQSAIANESMGSALAQAGRTAEAADCFARALSANPACIPAEDALMRAAMANEVPADASRLRSIIETNPVCRKARADWFTARAALGDERGAIAYFEGLARLQLLDAGGRANLARARRQARARARRG
ncbi:MAG: hypothetical protein NTY77_03200 [Elusimicrobia bacterium]|nr:hypothetical protein [Elusimicrobiota bacterium]